MSASCPRERQPPRARARTGPRQHAPSPPPGIRGEPSDAERGRTLLAATRTGALATVSVDGGFPFGSLVAYAVDDVGRPLLCLSDLAEHSRNLAADSRASLMASETWSSGEALSPDRRPRKSQRAWRLRKPRFPRTRPGHGAGDRRRAARRPAHRGPAHLPRTAPGRLLRRVRRLPPVPARRLLGPVRGRVRPDELGVGRRPCRRGAGPAAPARRGHRRAHERRPRGRARRLLPGVRETAGDGAGGHGRGGPVRVHDARRRRGQHRIGRRCVSRSARRWTASERSARR